MKVNTINFERVKGMAVYKQLYKKIQQDILSGYLEKGDQLPSIRKCEQQLKISKTSVERAYEQLVEEGYIQSIPQKGYFVYVDKEGVSVRKSMLYQPSQLHKNRIRYDFRSQSMDLDSLDIARWKKYVKEVLDERDIATYGNAQGEVALRMALQKYAYAIRGVLCDYEQILIGSSFQSLLYVVCALFDSSCVVGMEQSGCIQAERVFCDYQMPIRKLASEHDGICMKALYESDVNVLYMNSGYQGRNHQPLHKEKREAVLQWAKATNSYIIEDDHNGELRYRSKLTPAMQGFDMGRHVLYIGSFSKLLLPSLRISYLVFTKQLYNRYEQRKDSYSPTSSKIEQLAFARYIMDGHMERHVKRLRKRYECKSTYMQHLLHTHFPKAHVKLEEASLQFLVQFSKMTNMDAFIEQAKEKQIRIQKAADTTFVLSFAAIRKEDMAIAIQELKDIWEQLHEPEARS